MNSKGSYFLFFIIACAFLCFTSCNAAPLQGDFRPGVDLEDPDYVLELISRLGHSLMRANEMENLVRHPNGEFNKRGLDLGLGRGFSGSQAAKHLMGLAAANYAGGPGRRKRSAVGQEHQQSFEGSSKFGIKTPAGVEGQLEKALR